MTKISNNFLIGTVNKDLDERLVPMGQLTDASNVSIVTSEEGQKGVVKNVLGNVKKTTIATTYSITNPKTVGKAIISSKSLVYNFICGDNHDAVIEYNALTNTTAIILKAATGGVLNFSKTKRIKASDVIVTGEGEGDLLAWTDGVNPPRIINIKRFKDYFAANPSYTFTSAEISVIKSPPSVDIVTELQAIGTEDNSNFIKNRFISFAYRYKYNDGYYSAMSSWTEYCFLPKSFNINYDTLDNDGMENAYNAVKLYFNTGSRDVISIDLLFRESGSSTVYAIDSFIKSEKNPVWGDNATVDFTFFQNKIYKVLPGEQYYRNFDNVPLLANAQTLIGNRILYGDFTEGRNLGVTLDYDTLLVGGPSSLDSAVNYDITDNVLSSTRSNIVDFSNAGVSTNGSTDYLNRVTNVFSLPAGDGGDYDFIYFDLDPFTTHNDSSYKIQLINFDTGVVLSEKGPAVGINSPSYGMIAPLQLTPINVAFYVSSNAGLEYSFNVLVTGGGNQLGYNMSYSVRRQLSFPKSPSYTYNINGDIIMNGSVTIDFTGFSFSSGLYLMFDFETTSYYTFSEDTSIQSYTYLLSNSYTSLSDFYTNSNIKDKIENKTTGWSNAFKANVFSSDGTIVDFQGFKTSISGNFMTITLPYQWMNVSEGSFNELKYEFFKINTGGFNLKVSQDGFFKSLHSNRDYEIALIYMDAEGRKTTALVDSTNAINIPASRSDYINRLQVTINNNPPTWADRYKFAIKQIKKDYETIYISSVFKDETNLGHRWLKLDGQNINKVKTGDELIVKSDSTGLIEDIRTVIALEVKQQEADFVTSAPAGLYLKISPVGVNIQEGEPILVSDNATYHNPPQVNLNTNIFDGKITPGTRIKVYVYSDEHSNGNAWSYDKPYFISNSTYSTFKNWYDSEFPAAWGTFDEEYVEVSWSGSTITIRSREGGYSGSGTRYLTSTITVLPSASAILETMPEEDKSALFFETPKTYKIINGLHNSGGLLPRVHLLSDAWNCFCWGNGAESYKIKDRFNDKKLIIDFNPTAVSEDKYRQINRFADLTYSEVLQESTNVNRLNEFNLYLANYKDDMEKSFGRITNIKGFDTNIDVIQEDKYSVVYYGKDLLYNADGTTNLQKIPQVLGQQKALDGEYGSQFSDGFDFYGTNRFFPDVKRGTVMQKSNQGLVAISNYGMNYDFTKLFRDNVINNIIGEYDQHLNVYVMNVKYNTNQYVTWLYSDESNGWVTTQTFNPEDMCRMNGEFYSFYGGEIYRHNDSTNYNTFYGTLYDSSFSFNMNIEPGTRKVFRTLSTEGTDTWIATCVTDQQNGHIEIADYQTKEGVRYAYVRGDNTGAIDTATPAVQGIGVITSISGLNVITGVSVPNLVNIGDKVYKSDMTYIGTISAILSNGVTLSSVVGLSNGDFIIAVKSQSVETSGLLGYYMNVTLKLSGKNTRSELYQVNSEVSKSFM